MNLAASTELKLKINRFLLSGRRGTRRIEELECEFENVRADVFQSVLQEMIKEKLVVRRGDLFFHFNQFGRPCTPDEILAIVKKVVR